jgi:hypothetical protein
MTNKKETKFDWWAVYHLFTRELYDFEARIDREIGFAGNDCYWMFNCDLRYTDLYRNLKKDE